MSLQNFYYQKKEEQGDDFNEAEGFAEAHKIRKTGAYPDEATREICEQVQELAKDIPVTKRKSSSNLIPVFDKINEKRHGGFEMGMGRGYSRKLMRGAESTKILGTSTSREKEKDIELERLRRENAEYKRREAQREEQLQMDPLGAIAGMSQLYAQHGRHVNFSANPEVGSATYSGQSSGRPQYMPQIDPIAVVAMMSQAYGGQFGVRSNFPLPRDGHVMGSSQSGQSNDGRSDGDRFDDMMNENIGSF